MHHTIFLTTPISLELDQLWNLLPPNHLASPIFDLAFKDLPVHHMSRIPPLVSVRYASSMNVCFLGHGVGILHFLLPSVRSCQHTMVNPLIPHLWNYSADKKLSRWCWDGRCASGKGCRPPPSAHPSPGKCRTRRWVFDFLSVEFWCWWQIIQVMLGWLTRLWREVSVFPPDPVVHRTGQHTTVRLWFLAYGILIPIVNHPGDVAMADVSMERRPSNVNIPPRANRPQGRTADSGALLSSSLSDSDIDSEFIRKS